MFLSPVLQYRLLTASLVSGTELWNFDNAVLQPPYWGVEWGRGAGTALAHPPRKRRLSPICLPCILFSILSSIILWLTLSISTNTLGLRNSKFRGSNHGIWCRNLWASKHQSSTPEAYCHRRSMETGAKAKGRRVCLRGAEFIQFLSELAILPRSIWKIGWINPIHLKRLW